MSEYFEIAYAAASNQLCLFTGTGFSKAVTNNEAPSWQGLLEDVCNATSNPNSLKTGLFPGGVQGILSLEESAQVIAIELSKVGKDIHDEIAQRIRQISIKGEISEIENFLKKRTFKVITTNYDKLIEEIAGAQDCHSLTPGLPIPRASSRVKVYHVHGSIDSPKDMVVTSDDYFRFINGESYFSRKLSTVLHENTVVIIGYSLGDTNLKAILSDYKGFSRSHVISSNIFLVSRTKIDQHIKDYYSHCYGIRVLDQVEVCAFFRELNSVIPDAEAKVAQSIDSIRKVIFGSHSFTKDYLKIENSFFEIISSLAAIGVSVNQPEVVKAIGNVIAVKIELTQEYNAWNQYEQLAKWLVYLASILELKNTSIEEVYLNAALRSMTSMRKSLYIGYSWHAYTTWSTRWASVISSNRGLIRKFIEDKTIWQDALDVVRSG